MNFASAQMYILASLSDEISELTHDGFSMLKTVEMKDRFIYRFVKEDSALLILERNETSDDCQTLTLEKSEPLEVFNDKSTDIKIVINANDKIIDVGM